MTCMIRVDEDNLEELVLVVLGDANDLADGLESAAEKVLAGQKNYTASAHACA